MNLKIENFFEKIKPKKLSADEKVRLWNSIEYSIKNNPQEKPTFNSNIFVIMKIHMRILVPSFVGLFLVLGGVGASVLANVAKPGETLFPVKIAAENARLFLSFGQKRDELRIKFSGERLTEVKEVLAAIEADTGTAQNTSGSFQQATTTTVTQNTQSTTTGSIPASHITQANEALSIALDYLIMTKAKLLSQGNQEGALVVEAMISELNGIANSHLEKLEKFQTSIVIKDNKTKIAISAKTNDLKVKFQFKENSSGSSTPNVKITFDKKTKEDKKGNDDEDDDEEEEDEEDRDHKRKNKILICHKGKTIEVSKNALHGHLRHGDKRGSCDDDDDNEPQDTTPPLISNIESSSERTSAEIKWRTNENTLGMIWYGTTSPLNITKALKKADNDFDDGHEVDLSNLSASTTYYFIVVAKDAKNNTATGSEQRFTTQKESDTTHPSISGISTQAGTSTVKILWNTNESTKGKVYVGTTTPVNKITGKKAESSSFKGSHDVSFTGLSPNTLYYFIIEVEDAAGNKTGSEQKSFTTSSLPDTQAPSITGISVASSTIGWATNESATGRVWYGTTTPLSIPNAVRISNNAFVTSHSVNLSGLSASTTYYFIVASEDSSGNNATSSQHSFITP